MIDPDGVGHRTFIEVEELGRLSLAAFRLYEYAVVNSVRYGHAGFVCDDYLNTITAETTLTAMELVAAELWERRAGGYRVRVDDMVGRVIDQGGQTDSPAHACGDR